MEGGRSENVKTSSSSTTPAEGEDLELEKERRFLDEQSQAFCEIISSDAIKQCVERLQSELQEAKGSWSNMHELLDNELRKSEEQRASSKLEVEHLKDELKQVKTTFHSLKRETVEEHPSRASLMKKIDSQLKELSGKVDSVRKENSQLSVFLYTIMGVVLGVQAQFFNSIYLAKANIESPEARCSAATPTSVCSLLVFLCSFFLVTYTLLCMLHLKNTTFRDIRHDIATLSLERQEVVAKMEKHGEHVRAPMKIPNYESNVWEARGMVGSALLLWIAFNVYIVQLPYAFLCSYN